MAIPIWPTTLPAEILMEGYNQAFPDNLIRVQMDVGPDKVRKRTSSQPAPVSGRQLLTKAQGAILSTFYNTTLISGVLRFSWFHPITRDAVEFRFVSPPSWFMSSGYIDVQLDLEILP
jgi:hypothetical protein